MATKTDEKAKAEAIAKKLGGGWKIRMQEVFGSYDLELSKGKVRLHCGNFPGPGWDAYHVSEDAEIPSKLFRTPYAALGALQRRMDRNAKIALNLRRDVYFGCLAAK